MGGNIKNYNFNRLDLRLSNSDYWDFYLAADGGTFGPDSCTGLTVGDCSVVWYDFNNLDIFPNSATTATTIFSLITWDGAVNTGYTMNTIGLTGIDNGLITFDKTSGDTTNQALLSALTGSTLVIPSGDTRLQLTRVTGTTGEYIYPMEWVFDATDSVGSYASLCGGFYQGYYKLDGNSYEVLPVRVNQAWSAEFWLNPTNNCSGFTGTTLNEAFPNNKGFFFYMGTRAENKFWNTFEGVDTGCTSGCTADTGCTDTVSEWCTVPKETDIILSGDSYYYNGGNIGIPLSPPLVLIDLVTNPFLIYGRAAKHDSGCGCSGCYPNTDGLGTETVCTYTGGGINVVTHSQVITNTTNPFLIYGRASKSGSTCGCSGCYPNTDGYGTETVCSFTGFSEDQTTLDYNLDIIDNALGFRIKDDGSIGYRLLTVTGSCVDDKYVTGSTIEEAYSLSGMVSADTWSYIAIRFVTNYMDDCDLKTAKPRTGKLMFYVNGKLKFVVEEFDEFVARRLNDYYLKQVAVPFNISLGGGSQGLLESQTFDGLDPEDRGLPIETNFAGTFIGNISQFKFNICDLSFCDIQYNYNKDKIRYGIDTNLILQEDGFLVLQETGYGIEWT